MAKKKSVVWLSVDRCGYEVRAGKPKYVNRLWVGSGLIGRYCIENFERLFPFFKMPSNSLGKITNTANTLTFEIVETK